MTMRPWQEETSELSPSALTAITVGELLRRARILDRLFGRAIADCERAAHAIDSMDMTDEDLALERAYELISALGAALHSFVAPRLEAELRFLYFYVERRFESARCDLDLAALNDVVRILSTLRHAFTRATQAMVTHAWAQDPHSPLLAGPAGGWAE